MMDFYELYNTDTEQRTEDSRWMDWNEAKKRNRKFQKLGKPYQWVPYAVEHKPLTATQVRQMFNAVDRVR